MELFNKDCFELIENLPNKSIDVVVTDPPYWHHKSPGKPYSQRNQCVTESTFSNSPLFNVNGELMHKFSDFTDKEIFKLCDALKPKLKIYNAYFCCSESQVPYYCLWAEQNKLMFTILVWEKPLSIINKNRYSQNLEYIVRIYDYGTGLNKTDFNEYYNRVDKSKPISGKKKLHPTEKPIELFKKFITLSSKEGDTVFDPFMGSGVCGVACKELNRNFIGCELDEKYFAVAKDRIENYIVPLFSNI